MTEYFTWKQTSGPTNYKEKQSLSYVVETPFPHFSQFSNKFLIQYRKKWYFNLCALKPNKK
jgi:hypothetical protein